MTLRHRFQELVPLVVTHVIRILRLRVLPGFSRVEEGGVGIKHVLPQISEDLAPWRSWKRRTADEVARDVEDPVRVGSGPEACDGDRSILEAIRLFFAFLARVCRVTFFLDVPVMTSSY
jgi:hypothetical protein